MRFVNHQNVPDSLFKSLEHFGSLDEVKRNDAHPGQGPGIHPARERGDDRTQKRPVDDGRGDVEAAGQLTGPLIAEAGWGQDQGAVGVSSHQQLFEHEAGLNGFAETDLVGEQQPGRLATKDGKRRLQLVSEQVDPGRGGGLEGIVRRVVTG